MKNNKVFKIILTTIKNQKKLSFGILVTVILAIVIALAPPLVLGDIIDSITLEKAVSLKLILLYSCMVILTGISESLREGLLTVFGQKITHALRSEMMCKYIRLTTDTLSKQEPGSIVSRFIGDADTVEALFTSGIISMFADACKIISILAIIFLNNKGLAMILIILLPFLFLFTRLVQKNMLKAQLANRKAISKASGHVPETVHNIRTIHVFAKEEYMEEKYDKYIGDSYKAMEKTNFYDAIYSPIILILNAIVVAIVMVLSATENETILIFFGMSAGTAVAIMNYISEIFTPIESLGMEIQTIQSAIAGVERMNEFFALPEKEELKVTKERTDTNAIVNLDNVTFGYDERKVVDQLSFKIKKGEQVTLSGRTGAGKSTIFKLILGLYKPNSGVVEINGYDPYYLDAKEKRKLYGYVEQTFHRVNGTVKDQITLFDETITDKEMIDATKIVGLNTTIENFEKGYDTPCSEDLFSQGQWQLLSIARAIVSNPELLLLDEITANLDADTEKTVLDALQKVSKDRTVISISHRLNATTGRIINI